MTRIGVRIILGQVEVILMTSCDPHDVSMSAVSDVNWAPVSGYYERGSASQPLSLHGSDNINTSIRESRPRKYYGDKNVNQHSRLYVISQSHSNKLVF